LPFSKLKSCLTAITLFILIVSTMISFTSEVEAAQPTVTQKGLSIINSVAGVDVAKYFVSSNQSKQFLNITGTNEQQISYLMQSSNSKINVSCVFSNDKLHMLYVLGSEGSPEMITIITGNVGDKAQNYLSNYATFTQNSLFADLSNSIKNIDVTKNSSVTYSNFKLQVNTGSVDNYTTFSWMYTNNGVDAPEKSVAVGYQNGELKYFVDAWSIYSIGSVDMKLSEKDAVSIAMQKARDFSYQVGSGNNAVTVSGLNVTCVKDIQLLFCDDTNSDNSRSNVSTVLYPMWRIGVGLDKWYPDYVYGVYVDIWADTGQVKQVKEVVSSLPPEYVGDSLFDNSTVTFQNSNMQSNSPQVVWLELAGLTSGVFTVTFVYLFKRKIISGLPIYKPRLHYPKLLTGLLCLLLLSGIFLSVFSSVARADTRSALIFGDRDYLKAADEQTWQTMLSTGLENVLGSGGYTVSNYQGEGTLEANILSQVSSREQCYDKNLVVYFDHGIGKDEYYYTHDTNGTWHYSVYDNTPADSQGEGNPVFDKDIYPATAQEKTYFAFISTCMSASITNSTINNLAYGNSFQGVNSNSLAVGMPFAWTHHTVGSPSDPSFNTAQNMSLNGYTFPDDGAYCYIGFPTGSPSLSMSVDTYYPTRMYGMWVYAFFWFAINNDISINSALDQATAMLYNTYFGPSALHNGFSAKWGSGKPFDNSIMAVYGNGNNHLYYQAPSTPPPPDPPVPTVTICAGGWNSGMGQQYYLEVPFTIGNLVFTSEDGPTEIYYNFLPPNIYPVWVPEYFDGQQLLYVDVNGGNVTTNPFYIDARYYVQHILAVYGFMVNATAVGNAVAVGGVVSPSAPTLSLGGEYVEVSASPDSGWAFDYWVLDGEPYSVDSTVDLYMNRNYDIQAVFYELNPVFHDLFAVSSFGGVPYIVDSEYDPSYDYVHENYLAQVNLLAMYDGFAFSNWIVNGSNAGSSLPLTINMTDNFVVSANFTETAPHCFLTLPPSSGGYCYVPIGYYVENTTVTLGAFPDSGFQFDHWTVDNIDVGNNNPLQLTMDTNHTVLPYFTPIIINYTVSFSAISGGGEPWMWFGIGGVDVYVDGNYAGPADGTQFLVSAGEHNFTFTDPAYDLGTDWWYNYYTAFTWSYPYFYTYYPGNPATINIQSNMDFYVYYDPQT
jgi:hypothetical protein